VRASLIGALLLAASCSGETSTPDPTPAPYPQDATLRLNHAQVKGTHNSYHIETAGTTVVEHQYSHVPLDQQLSQQGVRAFELDTRYDKKTDNFRVYHLGFIDEQTTCASLGECLSVLATWSKQHPLHLPLLVQIEPKDSVPTDDPEGYFAKMEAEILGQWPRDKIITPDDLKGTSATLREAVTTRGWPTLGESRGKILFFINNSTDFQQFYTRNRASLDGRLLFVEASFDDPFAAVLIINDPIQDKAAIDAAVRANFLVRTRADADGGGALTGGTAQREAALASGAQIISTDFPAPVPPSDYSVDIPGGTPARCNPLIAPTSCTPGALEDPAHLGP